VLWECNNIFVNAGLPALANLVAGVTPGQYVTAMGFGSSATAPAATDTSLTAVPTYYNAIGAHTFPSGGSVQFTYSLLTTDYGANGMTIQELGSLRTRRVRVCRRHKERRIPPGQRTPPRSSAIWS
jgi:hypothetical protein